MHTLVVGILPYTQILSVQNANVLDQEQVLVVFTGKTTNLRHRHDSTVYSLSWARALARLGIRHALRLLDNKALTEKLQIACTYTHPSYGKV